LLLPNLWFSWRALIQLPKAKSDLFMFAPSIICKPLLLVLEALSDPARSIKLNFPTCTYPWIPACLSVYSQVICITACDLDDVAFAPVASTVRRVLPAIKRAKISSAEKTSTSFKLATTTPFIGSSLNSW